MTTYPQCNAARLRTILALLGFSALGACGALSDADDKRLLASGDAEPNPLEYQYLYLARSIGSPKPCYLINDHRLSVAGFNSPGTQVSYIRSTCFAGVASQTGDPTLCDQVRSVSTLLFSGAELNREACRRAAGIGTPLGDFNLDLPGIIALAGYTVNDIDGALVEAGRFSSAAVAGAWRVGRPDEYWDEVRVHVLLSLDFSIRIDDFPSFGEVHDLVKMRDISWVRRPTEPSRLRE